MLTRRGLGSAAALGLALVAIGCGNHADQPPTLDGVYRTAVGAQDLAALDAPRERAAIWGTWTLVLDRGRFALTQDSENACAWAYGALGLARHNRMDWTVIDAGARPAAVTANQRDDRYRFTWSRYRDVLTLGAVEAGSAGYFAARPWRQIAQTPAATALSPQCSTPAGALEPTGAEHATPPRDARFNASVRMSRSSAARWTGTGSSRRLGPGRITMDGNVDFSREESRHRLTFAARFAEGEVRGCLVTTILRRPRGRYLWQADGQITRTSAALHPDLGLEVRLDALTRIETPRDMDGAFASDAPAPGASATPPLDRC